MTTTDPRRQPTGLLLYERVAAPELEQLVEAILSPPVSPRGAVAESATVPTQPAIRIVVTLARPGARTPAIGPRSEDRHIAAAAAAVRHAEAHSLSTPGTFDHVSLVRLPAGHSVALHFGPAFLPIQAVMAIGGPLEATFGPAGPRAPFTVRIPRAAVLMVRGDLSHQWEHLAPVAGKPGHAVILRRLES